jgi:hypothetical protein
MPRTQKSKRSKTKKGAVPAARSVHRGQVHAVPAPPRANRFTLFDVEEDAEEAELPKDEAGRRNVKRQYEELLGIRVEKLKGRILNRERINKATEGIYFVCAECTRVCHNFDEGLVADPNNVGTVCGQCRTARAKGEKRAATSRGPAGVHSAAGDAASAAAIGSRPRHRKVFEQRAERRAVR